MQRSSPLGWLLADDPGPACLPAASVNRQARQRRISQRSLLELIYVSTSNLTSVGLSDVLAIKPQARSVTIIEQLAGVMYVAMVISRLVALTVMRAHR